MANNFRFNLRFPGQYYDQETSLHYNYFRDYDPSIGRYVQSDPIGLAGGIRKAGAFIEYNPVTEIEVSDDTFSLNVNTFGYVGSNPVTYADTDGLLIMSTVGGAMRGVSGNQAATYGSAGNAAAYAGSATAGAVAAGIGIGMTTEAIATRVGFDIRYGMEYKINSDIRIAPWGNRTGNPFGRWPHYHARGPKGPNGEPGAGKGIGRHRPWEPNSNDKNWCDRLWP